MMWLLAFSVWLACKIVTWIQVPRNRRTFPAAAAYFVAWPGMDPQPFISPVARVSNPCRSARVARLGTGWKPVLQKCLAASTKVLAGAILIAVAVHLVSTHPFLASWVGMIGTVLFLHFGLFDLITLAWRARGVAVEPIMQHPLCAKTLADFWGRWNRGFRDLAFRLIFRPLHRRIGIV